MVRGKKIGLGEFLGDQAAAYIPEAALPSGPRARADDDDGNYRGGRGGDRFGDRGGDRYGDREPSRSDQSDQWRGDRGGRGGGYGGGGDRFGRGGDEGGSWRGGGGGGDRFGGPSRYDRPARDDFQAEERPAHMRLNLARRGEASASGDARNSSGDKWSSAFGGGGRFGGGREDRYGRSEDRYDGGGRAAGRFARGDDVASSLSNMRVGGRQEQAPEPQLSDKKARAQQKREERKKKAEEERVAAEEAKRAAAEQKKQADEAAAKKAEADRETMKQVLASGKQGEQLAAVAKDVFAKSGRPSGAVVVEAVTAAAEDVAKASANWIALPAYGELLKLALEDADKKEQMHALYALQVFLNKHDFPKGLIEKCFMALYSLDIIEETGFFEYKYDVDGDVPGRMKAIIQTSSWLTWLETPEEESDEEDEE
ncbi:putative cleavage-induced protein [Phytophthora cinnamomi]|uniref:putative cleavage-induced protein n=1 Tax=Phytophthora cinnamomi TaxID=4785 RepID=UPI00355A1D60|nr:putative cleavage-induced protein [Phytophthora cinnamomi]